VSLVTELLKQFAMSCLAVSCTLLPWSSASAEIFDVGGMYTYHYRDGRYADWGDYALHGTHIAIREMNAAGILGGGRLMQKNRRINLFFNYRSDEKKVWNDPELMAKWNYRPFFPPSGQAGIGLPIKPV